MCGATDNRATQTSLTLALSPRGAREPERGRALQSHRHHDVRVLLIRLRPDHTGAYVVAESQLYRRVRALRNHAQRLLHVRCVESDREFFALEIDIERFTRFSRFRTCR